jgi:adenylate cyclase
MTKQQKRRLKRALLGVFALSFLVVGWDQVPLTRQMEQATLDYRYLRFNRSTPSSKQVVLIDIDEQSLKALAPSYGRWPWPRKVYKDIIEFLAMGEPSAILFDLLFTEAQLGSDDDQLLAQVSQQVPAVSHAMQFTSDRGEDIAGVNPLPSGFDAKYPLTLAEGSVTPSQGKRAYRDYLIPNPELLKLQPRIHVVSTVKDSDGAYRRKPVAFNYEGKWYPSMLLQGVRSTLKDSTLKFEPGKVVISGTDPESNQPKTLFIPMDQNATVPLHFYDDDKRAETIPVAAVIDSAIKLQRGEVSDPAQLKVNPFELKNKVILIGGSAAGLEDLKATPISPAYPGVLLHATAISNALTGDFLRPVPQPINILIGFVFLLLVYYSSFYLHSIAGRVMLPLGALAAYNGAALYLFQTQSLALSMAMPSIVGLLGLLDGFAYISFVEGAERKRLTGTLNKYLSPAVAEQMAESGSDPTAEVGRNEELSILFSDIRGFTTLSEKAEAGVVVAWLNEYLGKMTDVVFECEGTLDKFIGDAVMAFWGAPVRTEDHALRAVRAAMKMTDALVQLKAKWVREGKFGQETAIGIGINTGKVIVGNIGSEKRLDYTVIGDNVNLASRIEGLTKQCKVGMLIGPRTYELVMNSIVCRIIDFVRVKGKTQHVIIYEPLCEASSPDAPAMRDLAGRFESALELYRKGDFKKALELFTAINAGRAGQAGGDGPSQVFIERCGELIAEPPQEWDGVYVAKTK